MPVDYSLGKIYKIECARTGNVFYGSTCEPILSRRISALRRQYKNYSLGDNKTKFTSVFVVLQYDNCEISLVETYPCKNKDELIAREKFYIGNNPHCVNRIYTDKRLQREFRQTLNETYDIYQPFDIEYLGELLAY